MPSDIDTRAAAVYLPAEYQRAIKTSGSGYRERLDQAQVAIVISNGQGLRVMKEDGLEQTACVVSPDEARELVTEACCPPKDTA